MPLPLRQAPERRKDRNAQQAGRRIFDAANGAWMVKVFPGESYVTSSRDEFLMTVLGSCVSACIRHPASGIGGMNHFMLAQHHSSGWGGDMQSMRFGNFAMEKLINELMKAGCPRDELEVKVFGGANVTNTANQVGSDNAEFVMRYLAEEGLRCVAQDLGGKFPRRIHYWPSTGKAVRKLLGRGEEKTILREETEYARSLSVKGSTGGEVELFD